MVVGILIVLIDLTDPQAIVIFTGSRAPITISKRPELVQDMFVRIFCRMGYGNWLTNSAHAPDTYCQKNAQNFKTKTSDAVR